MLLLLLREVSRGVLVIEAKEAALKYDNNNSVIKKIKIIKCHFGNIIMKIMLQINFIFVARCVL